MATVGHIKEIKTVDGHIVAVVMTGTGQSVTATIMQAAGAEFYPRPGDTVLFHWAGQEVLVSAVLSEDTTTEKGESLIFSRGASGEVAAKVHLKTNGDVVVGDGASPVALAQKVDALWDTLYSVFTGWSPVSKDGGGALKTAFTAAFSSNPQTVGSSNLRAD